MAQIERRDLSEHANAKVHQLRISPRNLVRGLSISWSLDHGSMNGKSRRLEKSTYIITAFVHTLQS